VVFFLDLFEFVFPCGEGFVVEDSVDGFGFVLGDFSCGEGVEDFLSEFALVFVFGFLGLFCV